ncbi:MAG: zinc-ribbon domain-containing protein [Anaerolineales bacterium]|nr:zinc-ribbon domain-containing protein [Anaerolineales bacterium]
MARKKIGHIELQWTCPNCNGINPGPDQHCGNCGAPQPDDVEFEQAERQEIITDEQKIAQAEAGADIHCPFCGSRNPAGTEVCHNCGGDLVEGIKRESGRVVGAYKTGPVEMIPCPHCGEENPDHEKTCAFCGSSLAQEKPAAAQSIEAPKSASKTRTWIILGVIAVLVIACGAYLFFANRTQPTTAMVENVNWERTVPVEALVAVDHKGWEDEISSEAVKGPCSQEVRNIQSESAPNSVEVCGTPYTVDSGSGFAEVVQDCEYEVYASFCTFTLDEWQVVDLVTASGTDFSPFWPEPIVDDGQRVGEEWEESYTIVFVSGDEIYSYTTTDINLYQAAQVGSEWTLNINTFGSLVSIEQ